MINVITFIVHGAFGVFFLIFTIALETVSTSVALSSVPSETVGVASAVNNAVARSAALLWIAALPPLVGLTGASYTRPEAFLPGYRLICVICAVALFVACAVAAAAFRSHTPCGRHLVFAHLSPHPSCR